MCLCLSATPYTHWNKIFDSPIVNNGNCNEVVFIVIIVFIWEFYWVEDKTFVSNLARVPSTCIVDSFYLSVYFVTVWLRPSAFCGRMSLCCVNKWQTNRIDCTTFYFVWLYRTTINSFTCIWPLFESTLTLRFETKIKTFSPLLVRQKLDKWQSIIWHRIADVRLTVFFSEKSSIETRFIFDGMPNFKP